MPACIEIAMTPSAESNLTRSGRLRRIVLIDDDDCVRSVLCALLRRMEFEVEEFAFGSDALAWLQDHTCDVVVTDLSMPDMCGREILQWLEQHRPGLPVIVISGADLTARPGSDPILPSPTRRVLHKPFGCRDLEAVINELAPAECQVRPD